MPRRHPPEKRAAVLADAPTLGVTATARKHDVSPGYVSKVCAAEGVETLSNERTAKATEASQLRWAERRAGMVDDLGDLAAEALQAIRASLTVKPRQAADLSRVLD